MGWSDPWRFNVLTDELSLTTLSGLIYLSLMSHMQPGSCIEFANHDVFSFRTIQIRVCMAFELGIISSQHQAVVADQIVLQVSLIVHLAIPSLLSG